METIDNQAFNEKNTNISTLAIEIIRSTVPWMKFIAIMGFIILGFLVISAVMQGTSNRYDSGVYMVVYLIVAIVGIFPNMFLFQYASNLSYFIESGQQADLEYALAKQKSMYVFCGVLMIIYIVFVLLALLYLFSIRY